MVWSRVQGWTTSFSFCPAVCSRSTLTILHWLYHHGVVCVQYTLEIPLNDMDILVQSSCRRPNYKNWNLLSSMTNIFEDPQKKKIISSLRMSDEVTNMEFLRLQKAFQSMKMFFYNLPQFPAVNSQHFKIKCYVKLIQLMRPACLHRFQI